MSAYVVHPEHIIALALYAANGRGGPGYSDKRVDPRYLNYQTKSKKIEELAERNDYPVNVLAQAYADILYGENIRSVQCRYENCQTVNDLPGLIEKPERVIIPFTRICPVVDPVWILSMCVGLDYQSCETDDWRETDAYKLIRSIKEAAIRELPGYDNAPWEYTGKDWKKD